MAARVLVVDDDRAIRMLIRVFLESGSGFEVVGEADDCDSAISKAAELMPDLITMDHGMPGEDGARCIQLLKERWPDVHILAVTGSGPETGQQMVDAGAYAHIDKAHLQTILPALYQVADRRTKVDRRAAGNSGSPAKDLTSIDHLRDVLAALEDKAAADLAKDKERLAQRVELCVALRAVLVAASNPNYTPEESVEVIKELTSSVLQTEAANPQS